MADPIVIYLLCAALLILAVVFLFREICHAREKALLLQAIDDCASCREAM